MRRLKYNNFVTVKKENNKDIVTLYSDEDCGFNNSLIPISFDSYKSVEDYCELSDVSDSSELQIIIKLDKNGNFESWELDIKYYNHFTINLEDSIILLQKIDDKYYDKDLVNFENYLIDKKLAFVDNDGLYIKREDIIRGISSSLYKDTSFLKGIKHAFDIKGITEKTFNKDLKSLVKSIFDYWENHFQEDDVESEIGFEIIVEE